MEKCCICMRKEKIGVIWGRFMDLFGVLFMDEWLFLIACFLGIRYKGEGDGWIDARCINARV